jgi:hypothetical protein
MDTNIVEHAKREQHRDQEKGGEPSLEERKARLLRQAEFHRSNILSAKSAIRQGSRPDVIWHNALDHATQTVRTRVDAVLSPTGLSVATLSPYALSILQYLRQRRLLKPAAGVVAAAAGLALVMQYRRQRHLH